ncbi:MAG: DUF58 domain-containing protein [Phycisphaeraceae bacterium]
MPEPDAALRDAERQGSRYVLASPQRVQSGLAGAQLANRAGTSTEFMDYREYQPGDDIRRIDWSAYARSDRLTVKLYREEVSPHVELVLDGSQSMDLTGTDKAAGAWAMAALLATAAASAGFTHRLWLAGDQLELREPGRTRPGQWRAAGLTATVALPELLRRGAPSWRPRSLRVLVSDLLWPDDPQPILRRLLDSAAGLIVVQVLAREDTAPPEVGNMELIDAETGQTRELFIDAAAQERYQRTLATHEANWQGACQRLGAVMSRFVAEDLLTDWNMRPLVEARVLRVS